MRLRALPGRRAAPGGFSVKIGCPRVFYGPLPLFPLPLSLWLGGGRRLSVPVHWDPAEHWAQGPVSGTADMLFSFKNKYHYTYPNTYIALYHSHAKLPVTHTHTHTQSKKLLTIPL